MASSAAAAPLRGVLFVLVLAASVIAVGCSGGSGPAGGDAAHSGAEKTAPPPAAPAGADSSAAPAPAAAGTLPASSLDAAQAALKAYETARDDLANDKTEGLAVAAGAIEEGANKAGKDAPENLKPSFDRLSAASAKLKTSGGKVEDARASFGEVSEAVVALLSVEPALAQGRYVFECPMTETYKKWVQVDDQIKNPYMGSRMLGCGMTSTWEP